MSEPTFDLSSWADQLAAGEQAALLVVSRYRVGDDDRAEFLHAARMAVSVLASQAGCRDAAIGQATDEADLFTIRTEWDGVGAYRKALSAYDVKLHTIPLLSRAIDESSAFEVIDRWIDGEHRDAISGRAADADSIGLGQAAAPRVPPVAT